MNMDPEPSSGQIRRKRHSESELEQQMHSTTAARSCHACNRKKIRCDKKRPCSSCTRSGRPSCSYPLSGPRVRRTKKTIMAEMVSRIASLENSLAKATDEQAIGLSVPRTPISETANSISLEQLARATRSENVIEKFRDDVLVQNGSSSQYFNEVFLSRVIGEVSSAEVDTRLIF